MGCSVSSSVFSPGSDSIVELTVYAAELNVVLARHLWPRAIAPPPLTSADRRSLAAQAVQNQRRPEQRVEVSFDGELMTEAELQVVGGNGGGVKAKQPASSEPDEAKA